MGRRVERGSRARLAVAREALQARLWPVPVAAVCVAVAAGLVLVHVDGVLDPHLSGAAREFVFDGDGDTARSVLSSIIGALVTATSLTFSLTVVAFQLASSQASPRLLRTFSRDEVVHATLAVFLGTFAYALTLLRAIRAGADGTAEFVPRVSITVAFVLALASVVMLVLFLAHLAGQLRVETMLRQVHDDTIDAVEVVAAEIDAQAGSDEELHASPGWATVRAPRSGFIRGVDRERLLRLAHAEDLRVVELHRVGAHLLGHLPLLAVDPAPDARTAARLAAAYAIGYERTVGQDYLFGVRQMVDIAAKALSPGVNDPTTAVHAIQHLAAVLSQLRTMPASPASVLDAAGVPRLAPLRADFAVAMHEALTQPRRCGAGDIDAASALLVLLREVTTGTSDPAVRSAVQDELDLLVAEIAAQDYLPADRERFTELAAGVREQLVAA